MLSAVFTVTLVFNTWIKNTAIIYTLITPLMHATATKLLRHMSTCIQIQVDGSQSSPFQGNSEMLKYPFHLEMKTCYLRNFLLNFSFSLTEINVTSWLCFLLLFLLLKKIALMRHRFGFRATKKTFLATDKLRALVLLGA